MVPLEFHRKAPLPRKKDTPLYPKPLTMTNYLTGGKGYFAVPQPTNYPYLTRYVPNPSLMGASLLIIAF